MRNKLVVFGLIILLVLQTLSASTIDLTPGLFQRRMLYWHRFAPESRMMRRVTDALIDYGHKVLRQD